MPTTEEGAIGGRGWTSENTKRRVERLGQATEFDPPAHFFCADFSSSAHAWQAYVWDAQIGFSS